MEAQKLDLHPNRSYHYLKHHKSAQTMRHVMYADTEADLIGDPEKRQTHHFNCGSCAYRRRLKGENWAKPVWRDFNDSKSFVQILDDTCKNKTRLYVWFHNAGYDVRLVKLVSSMADQGWKLTGAVIESPPFWMDFEKSTRKIRIMCGLNIFKEKLATLAELHGLKKGDYDAVKDSPDDLIKYCRNDVLILMTAIESWQQFLADNDLGAFRPTVASQAMLSYRYRFMNHRILIDAHQPALQVARQSYYGGRTECFYIGSKKGKFYIPDVNSMYPAMMASHKFPTEIKGYKRNQTADYLKNKLKRYAVSAEVTITIDKPAIPLRLTDPEVIKQVIPQCAYDKRPTSFKDKLIFPVGTFKTYLSTPELQWVLANGKINQVHRITWYRQEYIFKKYVNEIYKLRLKYKKTGNVVYANACKLLLNSLYGKFGQKGYVFEDIEVKADYTFKTDVHIDHKTKTIKHFRQIGHLYQEQVKYMESRSSHPAIAAHVTAYARMYMFNLYELAGWNNIYYTDTDSLTVNQKGMDNLNHLLHDTKLGKLGIEHECEHIQINTLKDYIFGSKRRTKGVKESAVWVTDNQIKQLQWSGLKGDLQDDKDQLPTTTMIIKDLKREYTKARILKSGFTRPYRLTECQSGCL